MIKLENISKYYYSANAVVPALRKIKLEFHVGEFVAITGESGSGKSTLLNIISGLDSYDDGELYIGDEATSDYDSADWENYRKNKIGFVFQNYNLIEHYSVLNNVESALLIQGYNVKEAKKAAKELIAKVGLTRQLHQKTSKLSSGQKQRLSIARALAKNTDIMIADEPTGNLDSENGKQIMQLLSDLSQDKLIITVTHNYEEAAPFVTRKVRLHDGEVVSDDNVNQTSEEEAEAFELPDTDPIADETTVSSAAVSSAAAADHIAGRASKNISRVKSERKIAWSFTRMNISTQPGRVIFYMMFLIITAAVSFIFLGDIYSNWDDTSTKKYDSSLFYNPDKTRIVVKKQDGSDINEQDMEKFKSIKHVKMADMYDYADDINYFFVPNVDYVYNYQPNDNPSSTDRIKVFSPQNWGNFMKSATCISKKDLQAGTLPKERNEVVVYSKDESILGTQQPCYFESKNTWNYNEYYTTMVTVVGLLKKPGSQVYFSGELCNMLSLAMYKDHYSLSACKNIFTNSYTTNVNFVPVIGEGLKYGEVRISMDLAGVNSTDITGEAEVTTYIGDEKRTFDAVVLNNYHESTSRFAEVSEDWFKELYQKNSKQASLYMTDYIYTDYVLGKLNKMGYDAISSFRLSSVTYDSYKLSDRNGIIFKALLVLLIISILEVLIFRSIMKIRNKDFEVLGSMGMNHKTVKLMNYFEMFLYTVISLAVLVLGANVLRIFGLHYLVNMMKYYNAFTYTIYIIFNLVVIAVTVWLFNRYLRHKQKWA